jgi:hypothetical protein
MNLKINPNLALGALLAIIFGGAIMAHFGMPIPGADRSLLIGLLLGAIGGNVAQRVAGGPDAPP